MRFTPKNPFKGSQEIDDAVLTLTEKSAAKIEWPLNRSLIWVFSGCMMMALIVLAGRVFYMNVVEGAEYRARAEHNSIQANLIPAPRGIIYDRFGQPLVHNAPSVDLIFSHRAVTDEAERRALQDRLRSLVHFEEGKLEQAFERIDPRHPSPVLLKARLSQEETLRIMSHSHELAGISLLKTRYREYSDSAIFSHIIGYEGKIKKEELAEHPDYLLTDSIGKQGIEKSYERELRGVHGFYRTEVDAFGRVKQDLGMVPPVPGNDLILNIDADLQKKVFDSLSGQLEKSGLTKGAAIALDPRNGAVRALVSLPSFDNNLFARGISSADYSRLVSDSSQPLFNRAIAGTYPPASTIKPILAVGALTEGVVTEHTEIESRGGISVGSFSFGDWKAHGFTDIRRAIAVSSDVFFYAVGGGYGGIRGMGMAVMKEYNNRFGLGEKTGIDLEDEASGLIPDPEWKEREIGDRWYVGDNYHAAIGQGFLSATPLQMANAIAAIANGGTLYAPRIVAQTRTPEGEVRTLPTQVIRDGIARDDILRIVREGMRETVTEGTAQALNALPLPVAGKTGTAEFGGNKDKTHGWFVSFAPYDQPELVLLVMVEAQDPSGYNTVPVTQEVYQWYFEERLKK